MSGFKHGSRWAIVNGVVVTFLVLAANGNPVADRIFTALVVLHLLGGWVWAVEGEEATERRLATALRARPKWLKRVDGAFDFVLIFALIGLGWWWLAVTYALGCLMAAYGADRTLSRFPVEPAAKGQVPQ